MEFYFEISFITKRKAQKANFECNAFYNPITFQQQSQKTANVLIVLKLRF